MSILWFGPTTYKLPSKDRATLNKIHFISKHFSLYIVALNPFFWPKIVTYQKVRFYLLPKTPPLVTNIIQMLFTPVLILLLIKHRINLLVSQGVILYGMISIIVKKILSILGTNLKVIIDVHGEWEKTPFLYRGKKHSFLVSNFIRGIGNRVLTNGDAIRVVNKVLYKKIASITHKPIYVLPIYTGIDFFLKKPSFEHQLDQKELILFAGNLYYIKGVQYLIQAISEISKQRKDLELIIAGEGPYKKQLQLLAKKYTLQDSVKFIGHVSKKFLRDLYYSSAVVVLPSLSEGLPRVIIEAMTCGRPVIASDVGGIQELIKDGENGFLVSPADPVALKSKIDFLLTNPQIGQKLGKNARTFILKNFSEKKLLEEYVELYKNAFRT